jgi:hypothetical protein
VVTGARTGRSSLGCLVALLLLTAIGYFAVNIGEAYWRFYQFQDAMKQEVRFATRRSDEQISQRLRAKADSLGLPEQAVKSLRIRRTARLIRVRSEYLESIELPAVVREIRFEPTAEARF